MKRKRPIFGYPLKEYWCDIGNLQEYRRAQHDMLTGKTGIPMPAKEIKPGIWVGQNCQVAASAKVEAPCVLGAGSIIGERTVIGPETVIGERVIVGAGATLRGSILWNDVSVGRQVSLENCIVTHQVQIPDNCTVSDGHLIAASH